MKINRLFEIIYMLLNKDTVSAQEFSEHFEVSSRTIYRDIDILSGAGVPIYAKKGKNGGFSLLPSYVMDKTMLSSQEKRETLATLKAFNSIGGQSKEIETAILKLSSIFGKIDADWLEIDFSTWTSKKIEEEMFTDIKTAIFSKKMLSFTYVNGKNQIKQRRVEPLKLCYKSMNWYLYAYCSNREDYRFFKLKRISNLKILNETFLRTTKENVLENLNYLEEKQDKYNVILEIKDKYEKYIVEEFENPKKLSNNSYQVSFKANNLEEVAAYALSYGEYCKVVAPKELINIVKVKIDLMGEYYL